MRAYIQETIEQNHAIQVLFAIFYVSTMFDIDQMTRFYAQDLVEILYQKYVHDNVQKHQKDIVEKSV
jgi:hypothetical protein